MSDRLGMILAIHEQPDDDLTRLAYADWLEEHGEPDRAAFIRIQVELAELEDRGEGKSLEADELRKKERAFLGPRWVDRRLWAAEACPELVHFAPPRDGSPLSGVVDGADRLASAAGSSRR